MPLALNPKETFPLVLDADKARPEAERAEFRFHFLTGLEWRERIRLLRQWDGYWEAQPAERTHERYEALMAATCCAVGAQLVGWSRLLDRAGREVPFAADALSSVATDQEARELLFDSALMSLPSVTEKNASGSPSPSPMDGAAAEKPAAQAAQTAPAS